MIYPNFNQEELERLILGTILTILNLVDAQKLNPEYFTDIRNRAVFEIMLYLDETQQPINEEKIAEILKYQGVKEEGIHYLEQLKKYTTNNGSFKKLVDLLKERYWKKKMETI